MTVSPVYNETLSFRPAIHFSVLGVEWSTERDEKILTTSGMYSLISLLWLLSYPGSPLPSFKFSTTLVTEVLILLSQLLSGQTGCLKTRTLADVQLEMRCLDLLHQINSHSVFFFRFFSLNFEM